MEKIMTRKQGCLISLTLVAVLCSSPISLSIRPIPNWMIGTKPVILRASWYGVKWAGRKTASGTVFAPSELTVASLHYPLGTMLLLRRAGRLLRVKVTDRGPYVPQRQLDTSEAVAMQLGFVDRGVTLVEVWRLNQLR